LHQRPLTSENEGTLKLAAPGQHHGPPSALPARAVLLDIWLCSSRCVRHHRHCRHAGRAGHSGLCHATRLARRRTHEV